MSRATSGPLEGYPRTAIKKFKEYHEKNPHVWEEFKRLAFQMKATGRNKYSAKVIYNVMRWNSDIKATGEVFKMPDQYHAMYSRMLAHKHPEFLEFFNFRSVRCRDIPSEEETKRVKELTPARLDAGLKDIYEKHHGDWQ